MKKYLMSLLLLSSIAAQTLAQENTFQESITIKLSPALCYSRVHTSPDTTGYASKGMTIRGKGGATYNWSFKEHYSVMAGLFFVAQELGIRHEKNALEEHHEIQFLQLPFSLKLYTSEIDLDLRCYGEFGLFFAFKINDHIAELIGSKQPMAEKLRIFEVGAFLGGGIEYNISLTTSLFIGLTYQPALSSIISQKTDGQHTASEPASPPLYGYLDMISLDMGIRF